MNLTIQDFRGLSAEIELGQPLTLIVGPNGAGKSRIAEALGRVISGDLGSREEGKEIASADKAIVRLNGAAETFKAAIWPERQNSVRGDQDALPQGSIYAVGLAHPLDVKGKERAQAFADIFHTEPTKKNLADALEKRELAHHLESIWGIIEISGWDAATGGAEGFARTFKAAWREVTGGATWGKDVGGSWQPPELDQENLREELQAAEAELAHAHQTLEARRAERAKLPERIEENVSQPCPWCEKPVKFKFGKLVPGDQAEKRDSREIKELWRAIAEADGQIAHAQDQVYHHEQAVGAAKARLTDSAESRTKAKARAGDLHEQILEQVEIAEVCGPNGLRRAKFEHVLDRVNEHLAELAKAIQLPLVELSPELEVAMHGTAYRRLSRGEQWLARTILQIEIARWDRSSIVVVDDLDVPIDPKDRNNVLQALHQSGLQAVVMCAARAPEPRFAPDLSQAGLGLTYWIDRKDGLRPIADVAPAWAA